MEQILINGLSVESLIGVYDWERTQSTRLLIDLTLEADLRRAMESDDVNDTLDYAKVAELVQQVCKDSCFQLLEALGFAVMKAVLQAFPARAVSVCITKPNILSDAQQVAVRLSLSRQAL